MLPKPCIQNFRLLDRKRNWRVSRKKFGDRLEYGMGFSATYQSRTHSQHFGQIETAANMFPCILISEHQIKTLFNLA